MLANGFLFTPGHCDSDVRCFSLPRPGKPECVLYDEQSSPQSKSKSWSALRRCQRCSRREPWGQLQVGLKSQPKICRADAQICRDDVMLGSKKVSGTAAKLGRDAAYHHCTLLLNVDTSNLHSALNRWIPLLSPNLPTNVEHSWSLSLHSSQFPTFALLWTGAFL